jgi:hypothetical protein
MTPTPLYHTTLIAGPTGVSFALGETLVFTSADDPTLYTITAAQVMTRSPVEPGMADYLRTTLLEPRLLALTGKNTP